MGVNLIVYVNQCGSWPTNWAHSRLPSGQYCRTIHVVPFGRSVCKHDWFCMVIVIYHTGAMADILRLSIIDVMAGESQQGECLHLCKHFWNTRRKKNIFYSAIILGLTWSQSQEGVMFLEIWQYSSQLCISLPLDYAVHCDNWFCPLQGPVLGVSHILNSLWCRMGARSQFTHNPGWLN